MFIVNAKLFKMKKLIYLFVMVAGMTLATANVNAQDAKSSDKAKTEACSKSGEKSACCKSGDKAACCKSGDKGEAGKCCKKDAAASTKK
jgi:hypothetical protein